MHQDSWNPIFGMTVTTSHPFAASLLTSASNASILSSIPSPPLRSNGRNLYSHMSCNHTPYRAKNKAPAPRTPAHISTPVSALGCRRERGEVLSGSEEMPAAPPLLEAVVLVLTNGRPARALEKNRPKR